MFQLTDYLARFASSSMPLTAAIRSIGAELCSTRNLRSHHADAVIKELLKLRDNLEGEEAKLPPLPHQQKPEAKLPPPSTLKALSLILLDPSQYHSEILQSVGEHNIILLLKLAH